MAEKTPVIATAVSIVDVLSGVHKDYIAKLITRPWVPLFSFTVCGARHRRCLGQMRSLCQSAQGAHICRLVCSALQVAHHTLPCSQRRSR